MPCPLRHLLDCGVNHSSCDSELICQARALQEHHGHQARSRLDTARWCKLLSAPVLL